MLRRVVWGAVTGWMLAACGSSSSATPGGDAMAPADASGTDAGDAAAYDQFQLHNLDVINSYRATLKLAPLTLGPELCTFAIEGSTQLSMDHSPHAHFITALNDGSIWKHGFNTQAAENQGDPNGWSILAPGPVMNELDQIDAIQKVMFDEGPGTGEAHAHYTNMMDPSYTRVGVGLLEVAGRLYLTNDFSD